MFDENYVGLLTGLDQNHRNLLCTAYARLDETSRVNLHRRQRELFRDWVAEGRIPPNRSGESNYSALLLAIRDILSTDAAGSGNADGTIAGKPRKQRKQRLRNSLEKKYMGELVRLREQENLSWRQLSDHFRKEFKKVVSHTYLKRIYDEQAHAHPTAERAAHGKQRF